MLHPSAASLPAPVRVRYGPSPPQCSEPTIAPSKAPRLLDQLRERIRFLHYSLRTEQAYVYWCRAFIYFHDKRHPSELGGAEVESFLSWLASERKVSA